MKAFNLHMLHRPHKVRLDSPVRVIFSLNIEESICLRHTLSLCLPLEREPSLKGRHSRFHLGTERPRSGQFRSFRSWEPAQRCAVHYLGEEVYPFRMVIQAGGDS